MKWVKKNSLCVETIAYFLVGAYNTVFGMGLYALFCWLWADTQNYLILAVIVNFLAITNAFLGYKLIVFRTRGNWMIEYLRCFLVYGAGALIGMFCLMILVTFLGLKPAIANIFSTCIVIIASWFGHKFFSFSKNR